MVRNLKEQGPTRPGAASGTRLRFGIMCASTTFAAWQADCVRELMGINGVVPALLILDGGEVIASAGGARPVTAKKRGLARVFGRHTLWNLYNRAFVRGKLASERRVDLTDQLRGVPTLRCVVEKRAGGGQYFQDADVRAVHAAGLDFIVRFGFNIIRGEILSAARFGVWSYHHDDLHKYRGQPACFWEVYFRDPVTGVTLQRLTEGLDNGIVLGQQHVSTVLKSYRRNRDGAFLASTGLPAAACRRILSGDSAFASAAPVTTSAPIHRRPTNAQALVLIARVVRAWFASAWLWLFRHEQWGIGIVAAPIAAFAEPNFVPRVRWIERLPRSRIIADPFGRRVGDRTVVMAEELDHGEGRGRIVAVDWPDGAPAAVRRGVMEIPGHASYPYLIEHRGAVYCVPETGEQREVALYRATKFPDSWEKVCVLVSGVAALDSTLFTHGGRWWMMYAIKGRGGALSLRAMHAPELEGPWTMHTLDPLSADVRCSRPAGTPFVRDGVLYRPGQDCSATYGGAVSVMRVNKLTPTEFEEELVTTVRPDPRGVFPDGLHTISAAGDVTLIDGKRLIFVPAAFWNEVKKIAGKLMKRR